MFRIRVFLLLAAFLLFPFVLTGCLATSPPAYTYYDKCNAQTSSFLAMVECGKEARNAECTAHNSCSPEGTAFVQFSEALAMSVRNKEMTEAEAMRRYAEYKTNLLSGLRRDQAIVAAGAAASGPTTCTKTGNTVNCF